MNVFVKSVVSVCATLVAAALSQGVACASDPVGVSAISDKVVFDPSADAPERIPLFGVFAVAEPSDRNNYQAPQRGYLYFTLPAGKESIARKEWADLKQMSGKGQVVAFGSRFELRAHVRKADEKAAAPDLYQLSLGDVKVRST